MFDSEIGEGGRTLRTAGLAAASLAVVGFLDWRIGPDVSFSIFYLVPILLVVRGANRRTGMLAAILCAIVWFAVDLAHGVASLWWIHAWNALVRLGFFTIIVILLSAWRASEGRLRKLLDDRTTALADEGTQRRRTEERLAESEERFRQAQKMEAIGRLAAGIAHDFRNQVTVVQGYCSFVSAALTKGSPAHEDLNEIRQACARAMRTVDQLLAFGRKSMLRPEVTDVKRVLDEFRGTLGQVLGEDILVTVAAARDVGRVEVDVPLFHQAVLNLAANARAAMPKGGRLTIEAANVEVGSDEVLRHPEAACGPYVTVAISDTGVGMSKEEVAHAFEPFYTTKPSGKGTGLGLAMVYGFVRQSSGFVTLYSERGLGTTVRMYFPRAEGAARAELPPVPPSPARGRGETILLVEDEPQVRRMTERMLAGLGYRVLGAGGAAEAMGIVEGGATPDLLLTDVVMPETSGPALAQAVRARFPGLPVLYVSGYAPNAIVHHGMVDPGVELITKPFAADELANAVRGALDRRRRGPGGDPTTGEGLSRQGGQEGTQGKPGE